MGLAEAIARWSRRRSLWPVTFGMACCGAEAQAAYAPQSDIERMGVSPALSARQADLMIVAGPVSKKLADVLIDVYHQMPEPRLVVAFGSCACRGGPYHDSYAVIKGADKALPVDVYVAGCPPKPEALRHGLALLQRKIDAMRPRRP